MVTLLRILFALVFLAVLVCLWPVWAMLGAIAWGIIETL